MEYIKAAFARMNLHQISNFFLYGVDSIVDEVVPYSDALKKGCDPIYRRLDIMYPDITQRDKAAADLTLAFAVYENVVVALTESATATSRGIRPAYSTKATGYRPARLTYGRRLIAILPAVAAVVRGRITAGVTGGDNAIHTAARRYGCLWHGQSTRKPWTKPHLNTQKTPLLSHFL